MLEMEHNFLFIDAPPSLLALAPCRLAEDDGSSSYVSSFSTVSRSSQIFKFGQLKKRCKDKDIEGNILGKGEGIILGGVIVFDRRGNIRYAHQERFSHELPVDEIRAAIRQVVDEDALSKKSTAFSNPSQ